MKKIWFRVGMEAEVTDEELKELKDGERRHELMEKIISSAKLSGGTYILGKDCGVLMIMIIQKKKLTFYFRRY